jgi:hypothetical protein
MTILQMKSSWAQQLSFCTYQGDAEFADGVLVTACGEIIP